MPAGRHFAVTWSIPDDFGGMTKAMLRRSRAFHRFAGGGVEVLTFDDRPDYPTVEAALRARGPLTDGVTMINLYDWLGAHPIPPSESLVDVTAFAPLADGAGVERRLRGQHVVARVRRDAHGAVLQVDHLREDGSLVLSDRRDVRTEGTLGGRRVMLLAVLSASQARDIRREIGPSARRSHDASVRRRSCHAALGTAARRGQGAPRHERLGPDAAAASGSGARILRRATTATVRVGLGLRRLPTAAHPRLGPSHMK